LYLWSSWTSCITDPIIHIICQLGSVPSVWTLGTPGILCSTPSCIKGYNNCVSSLRNVNLLSLTL
jgi:hypothetical protein